jgi:hypothetical protein
LGDQRVDQKAAYLDRYSAGRSESPKAVERAEQKAEQTDAPWVHSMAGPKAVYSVTP